ncbi:hypothetical protein L198_07454 [Cryptococcus wingfieldii CBS 7118]|uniref:Uncharacterized protein n=1 Tax=Cryptococcus wingfieldii CBS 7118 TaxID=1295528 RepID=A0A1E3IBP9_9TREE|nr:hypothetical protein L198_07454 [Cryptococcus wingfieldii CBS 7118]ODN85888.1 hypothetical protein L198_07454 [Cryptococcus wingfieldii CBS 7118]
MSGDVADLEILTKELFPSISWKRAKGIIRGTRRVFGDDTHPEEVHWTSGVGQVGFRSSASGDRDGIILDVEWLGDEVGEVRVQGGMEGYVKIGDPLKPDPYPQAPSFNLEATRKDLYSTSPSFRRQLGGVGFEVAIERVREPGSLPSDTSGWVKIPRENGKHGAAPVWFVGRQGDGAKVWTLAIWLGFQGERKT